MEYVKRFLMALQERGQKEKSSPDQEYTSYP